MRKVHLSTNECLGLLACSAPASTPYSVTLPVRPCAQMRVTGIRILNMSIAAISPCWGSEAVEVVEFTSCYRLCALAQKFNEIMFVPTIKALYNVGGHAVRSASFGQT